MSGLLSLRSNVSWQEFQAGQTIREVFWRRDFVDGADGVVLFCSNDHSDFSGRAGDWSVFFMQGAKSGYDDSLIHFLLGAKYSA